MNSCNTDIFFSNYYHLQSVRFEFEKNNFNNFLWHGLFPHQGIREKLCGPLENEHRIKADEV